MAERRSDGAANEVSAAHDADQRIQTYVDEGFDDADGGLTAHQVGYQTS